MSDDNHQVLEQIEESIELAFERRGTWARVAPRVKDRFDDVARTASQLSRVSLHAEEHEVWRDQSEVHLSFGQSSIGLSVEMSNTREIILETGAILRMAPMVNGMVSVQYIASVVEMPGKTKGICQAETLGIHEPAELRGGGLVESYILAFLKRSFTQHWSRAKD